MKNILLVVCLLSLVGCAGFNNSYNQKLICGQIATNNAALPWVGGQSNGHLMACYYSCVGGNCQKADDGTMIAKSLSQTIAATGNQIVTAGPSTITVVPAK